MLLTRKSGPSDPVARSPFVHSLRRGLSQALPTMDRRAFLRRSGHPSSTVNDVSL